MYYNSNKSNNDYYNSYKKEISEIEAYKREKFIKVLFLFFTLALLVAAAVYLYKYFNPNIELKNEVTKSVIIKEQKLPISIQVQEPTIIVSKASSTKAVQEKQKVVTAINEKDITLIVETVMAKMNAKVEKPLTQELQEFNNKTFVNKPLKEENHYNKVVLTQNETLEVQNASLVELSTDLSNIINEGDNINSNYTQEITKETIVRKNEMRIIIVQKGDTLSKIAKKAYGRYDDYPKIFAANPEIIKNPNQIFEGQRLRIPA